jgi:hypothetical protein
MGGNSTVVLGGVEQRCVARRTAAEAARGVAVCTQCCCASRLRHALLTWWPCRPRKLLVVLRQAALGGVGSGGGAGRATWRRRRCVGERRGDFYGAGELVVAVRRVAVLVCYYTLLSWRCCCSWRCGALVGLLAGLHYTALSWWCCGERKLLVASLRAARGGAGGGDARNRHRERRQAAAGSHVACGHERFGGMACSAVSHGALAAMRSGM